MKRMLNENVEMLNENVYNVGGGNKNVCVRKNKSLSSYEEY